MTKQDLIGRKFRVQATGVVYQFIDDPQADNIQIVGVTEQDKGKEGRQWLVKYVLENLQDTSELQWELIEEHVVEVGDVYISKKYSYAGNKVVKSIYANNVNWEDKDFDHLDTLLDLFTLVSKANKQEIIGYELLKDLPGIPVGTRSFFIKVTNSYSFSCGIVSNTFSPEQTKDTTWFKPIYKVKEVVVKISVDRQVVVKENKLYLNDNDSMDFHHFEAIRNFVINGNMIVNGYSVKHSSVTIGCQFFTKEDIELVHKAIQNIK